MPVAELVDELAASRDRLAQLDDGERSVRAAFDLSYRRLPPEQARLLRLLALAPGPEVSDEVAAALVGTDAPPLRALGRWLVRILSSGGVERGRWRLHDLVRVFGVGVVAGDAVGGGGGGGAGAGAGVLLRGGRMRRMGGCGGCRGGRSRSGSRTRGEALGWLDGERAGLVAAAWWAREERFADTAVLLADMPGGVPGLAAVLRRLGRGRRAALEAAHRSGDRGSEAIAWNNLGIALRKAGRMEEAIEALTRARDLFQAAGDRQGEAGAWNNLGIALREAGRMEEAIDAHTRARDLFQADRGPPRARPSRGTTSAAPCGMRAGWRRRSRPTPAPVTCSRTAGDRHREAQGVEQPRQSPCGRRAGRRRRSRRTARRWRSTGSSRTGTRTGHVLHNLALVHEAADRPAEARACWLQAADAYAQANAPDRSRPGPHPGRGQQ